MHRSCLLDDEEFEVTAEMLIHQDLDDERTLEEEELLEENDATSELSDLQKVCYLKDLQAFKIPYI